MSRAWLQLLRLPNLFTVPGDPIVGFLLACGLAHQGAPFLDGRVAFAVVASLCLYSAGLVMNDLIDFTEDWRDRPKRPLPSGQVAVSQAWIAVVILGLLGIAAMYAVARMPGAKSAAALLCCVALYNGATKQIPLIGALNMGLCRGLSVMLGAVAFHGRLWLQEGLVITAAVIITIYIAAVTNLARHETRPNSPVFARLLPPLVLLLAFLLFNARLPFLVSPATTGLAIALTLSAVEVGRLAQKNPSPLPPVIGGLIRVLLVIQAAFCVVFPSPHAWTAAAVLVLAVPTARHFGKRFYAS